MVKDWRDLPDESTPILASELERIETDIESAANAAGAAVSTAAGFSGRVATAEGRLDDHDTHLTALDTGKASTVHGHVIADTTGLQAALDAKAPTSHAHTGADITSGVVKTINSTAPDPAGNVSVPAVVASTQAGQILVGDGAGGWQPREPIGMRLAVGARASVAMNSHAMWVAAPSFRLLKGSDGYVYAAPGANVLMAKSSSTTNYGAQTVTVCTFPPGFRPAVALTNGFPPAYSPDGGSSASSHSVDPGRSPARYLVRWYASGNVYEGPETADAPTPGAYKLGTDGVLTYEWSGSSSVQALGLSFNPYVPLFKAA